MKLLLPAMTALSLMLGMSTASYAACGTDTTASIDKPAGIAKDGTHAPLETPDQNAAAPAAKDGAPAAKDGNTMPLATQENGGDTNLATSQQDVEAQQHGDKTAAATADANQDCAQP